MNHANYGVLFAAMIQGNGLLVTNTDEEGLDLNFLTTDEILAQLMKFGFYITYDIKQNLPNNMLAFLATIDNIGFDKITRVALESSTVSGQKIWEPTILVIKSEHNTDLLQFDCKLTRKAFNEKLSCNYIMNVSHEEGMVWDWVTYICNISDILSENADPTKEFDIPEYHHRRVLAEASELLYSSEYGTEYAGENDGEADEEDESDSQLTEYGQEEADEP